MRLNSEKLKFLAIDEPTSALDPEGELELFNNLRAARFGKTMVFITHRFGPLTKYADRIMLVAFPSSASHVLADHPIDV
jgi:energy-coupling factor transporter ATP-binding protein EcfA2